MMNGAEVSVVKPEEIPIFKTFFHCRFHFWLSLASPFAKHVKLSLHVSPSFFFAPDSCPQVFTHSGYNRFFIGLSSQTPG